MRHLGFLFLFSIGISTGFAQQHSENGWVLTTKDTLRVLVLFVEIEYDTLAHLEDIPEGRPAWPKGSLPAYADSLFDPFYKEDPYALMSAYYRECSLDNLIVLGDYIPALFTVKYSEIGNRGLTTIFQSVSRQLEEFGTFISSSGLELKDFDLWNRNPGSGKPKSRNDSTFTGVDHVMVLIRNYHKLPRGNGMASGSSFGTIGGMKTNSYSVFNGGHRLPFQISRHELNHLLIGGNNFHAGGGNSHNFRSYVPFIQGGWSMMGAANSSFLTCSGWDRYWLGWKARGNEFLISARDEYGEEVNADLEVFSGQREFILRDFVTTGDAIRIKIPYLPEEEFQQWLWLENHQTGKKNNSRFDVYHYEDKDCVADSEPGLFAYMQIDANTKEGANVYGKVNADYLRPIPADGFHDIKWEEGPRDLEPCVNSIDYIPYYTEPEFENVLTGNHAQEKPFYTETETVHGKETIRHNLTRKVGDTYERMASFGHPRNGFRIGENDRLGIGTNPSTASMLSLLNTRKPTRPNNRNNREIYLSGISVSILEEMDDGAIRVAIRFDDHILDATRRWCAPVINLKNHNPSGPDLVVSSDLKLDRGETMTRFAKPDTIKGRLYFTDPTSFVVHQNAELEIRQSIILAGESRLIIEPGATLTMNEGSLLDLQSGTLEIKHGAELNLSGSIAVLSNSKVICEGYENYNKLKSVVKPRKRLKLLDGR